MKKIIYIIGFLISFSAFSQTPFPSGARFPNATKSDTLSTKTRIPIMQANSGNLINKYIPLDSISNYLTVPVINHANSHQIGGADEISGENLAVTVTPSTTGYTPTDSSLEGHLKGIDSTLVALASGAFTPATPTEINTGTDNTKMVTPLGLAGSDYFTKTQNDTYYKPIGYVPTWTEITGKPTLDGSETKVTAGTNVTITGTGTTASPYVVNSTASGSGHTIQDNGVSKTARTNLNFKNFVVDDNAANNSTDITAVVAGAPLTYNYTAVGAETSINTGVSIASNYQTEIYYGNAVLSPTIDYTLSYGATTTINFTFPLEAGYPIRVVYNSSSAPNAITDTDDVPEGTTNLYADANATNQGNTFNGANQLVKLDGTGKLPAIDGSNLTNLPSGGSGITSVVEDTTPQLGGDLDVNGNSIDSSGDMTFNAIGNDIIFNGLIVGNDGIYVAGSSSIFNNIQALGDVNFTDYGSGTKTGTATYNLAIDTNGNVIETALGGGGDMLKSENLSGLTNYSTARSNLGLVIGTNVLAPNGSAASLTSFPTLNQNTTGSAATLTTPRTINGTSFNGSENITTTNWGTSRNISIGGTSKAVTGGANVTWTQSEIGVNKTTIDALGINATTTTTSTSTGTAIDMGYKRQMNFGAASSASTFTMTNIAVGGYAEVLINGTTEPTVTGATKLPDTASWVTGTNMVLCVKDFNGTRKYWFVKF